MRIFFFDGRRHFGFRNTIETFLSSFIRVSVRHMQRRDVVDGFISLTPGARRLRIAATVMPAVPPPTMRT